MDAFVKNQKDATLSKIVKNINNVSWYDVLPNLNVQIVHKSVFKNRIVIILIITVHPMTT